MSKLAAASAALALIAVTGCATQQRFAERMNTYVGQHESVLIGRLGSPAGVYTYPSGGKTLTFERSSTMQIGGATTYQPVTTYNRGNVSAYGTGGSAYGSYSGTSTTYQAVQQPTYDVHLSCRLTVSVDDQGLVRSWQASGNHCVSQQPSNVKRIQIASTNMASRHIANEIMKQAGIAHRF